MSSPDDWRALISATEKFADAVFSFAYKRLGRGRSSTSRARSYPRRRSRSTWRSRSRSKERNRRADKPHDETRPSKNNGAPTSGAPAIQGGATMEPMQIVKTGDSRVVTTGNTVPGYCSAPAKSGGDQPAPTPGTAVTTKVTMKEKSDQPTSSQSAPKSFRIPKNTAKGGGTVTVEEIQEQIATDPKVGRKMANCLIKLSKKAKNKKTSPAKPKKRGSFKRIWVSDSPDSDVEEIANEAGGSQSPEITAVIPAQDIFSESE